MVLPEQPITLSAEQVAALKRALADMRHDINNHLTMVVGAVELIRVRPHRSEEMITTAVEQVARIKQAAQKFANEFDKSCGIQRD